MSQKLLLDSRVFSLLLLVDLELAAAVREQGCRCGGALHVANYPRKPRGAETIEDPRFGLRFSFCCGRDGCRARATPPSARFLDRRVYLGFVVVLVSALRQGPTPARMAVLRKELGVDVRTVQRWQIFWREEFPTTRCAKVVRSRRVGIEGPIPFALLEPSRALGDENPVVLVLRELAECAAIVARADRAA